MLTLNGRRTNSTELVSPLRLGLFGEVTSKRRSMGLLQNIALFSRGRRVDTERNIALFSVRGFGVVGLPVKSYGGLRLALSGAPRFPRRAPAAGPLAARL